ncbi:hypothetical protein HXA35_01555 [Bacillus sp. A301a_S52]|jgi:hypothetical protein|nr:hypothetical protein [Bacillus sp. A301a_S52]
MVIPENIYYRYESNIDGGTAYIFDVISGDVLKTSKSVYGILKSIDKRESMDEIISKYSADYSKEEIMGCIEELKNLKILSN